MIRPPPNFPPFPYPPLSRPADHRDGRGAGTIVLRAEEAAEPGVDAEHAEVVAGRGQAGGQFRVAVYDRRDLRQRRAREEDRKSTRLNSSHANISYAVFCLKK